MNVNVWANDAVVCLMLDLSYYEQEDSPVAAGVVPRRSRRESELEQELQHAHAQVARVCVFLCEHTV